MYSLSAFRPWLISRFDRLFVFDYLFLSLSLSRLSRLSRSAACTHTHTLFLSVSVSRSLLLFVHRSRSLAFSAFSAVKTVLRTGGEIGARSPAASALGVDSLVQMPDNDRSSSRKVGVYYWSFCGCDCLGVNCMCVCVCVCVFVCVCACMFMRVYTHAYICVCMRANFSCTLFVACAVCLNMRGYAVLTHRHVDIDTQTHTRISSCLAHLI